LASSGPTILQIIPRLDTGGAELSTLEITEAIVRAGGTALVATEGGRMADQIGRLGGRLIPFPAGTKNPIRLLTNAAALRALIERHDIALLHARSRAPAWSALLAARRAGIPFVTTYHGAYAESGPVKRLYNSVMARADRVIANSQFTADLIGQRYATPPARIRVIQRGVDLTRFDPAAIPPARVAGLRRRWGLETAATRIILQASRLTGWKGQTISIAAIDQLKQHGLLGDAILVLAGDDQGRGGYSDALRHDIERRGLGHSVRLVGHVDDMPGAFAAAHVVLIPSTEPEAFGRVAAEAQAMGCPVIASRLGAPPEILRALPDVALADATGWLVPPADPAALASALADALAMPHAQRVAMGGRARQRVADHFTLAAMKAKTLAVYDELLGTHLAARL
jgi:glycosyltransferase involved in cell wall biosynthesis